MLADGSASARHAGASAYASALITKMANESFTGAGIPERFNGILQFICRLALPEYEMKWSTEKSNQIRCNFMSEVIE